MDKFYSEKLIRDCFSNEGINLITDFFTKKQEECPNVEYRNYGRTILFRNRNWSTTDGINFKRSDSFTNTIGITIEESNINMYINAIADKNHVEYTNELKEFLLSIPSLLRDKKLSELIDI